jgi:hypothetical protein
MGVVAHSLPNYAVANAADDTVGYGPVIVKAFNTQSLEGQVNGMLYVLLFFGHRFHAVVSNLVFAYGGGSFES